MRAQRQQVDCKPGLEPTSSRPHKIIMQPKMYKHAFFRGVRRHHEITKGVFRSPLSLTTTDLLGSKTNVSEYRFCKCTLEGVKRGIQTGAGRVNAARRNTQRRSMFCEPGPRRLPDPSLNSWAPSGPGFQRDCSTNEKYRWCKQYQANSASVPTPPRRTSHNLHVRRCAMQFTQDISRAHACCGAQPGSCTCMVHAPDPSSLPVFALAPYSPSPTANSVSTAVL